MYQCFMEVPVILRGSVLYMSQETWEERAARCRGGSDDLQPGEDLEEVAGGLGPDGRTRKERSITHRSDLLLCDEPLQNTMAEYGKDLLLSTILGVGCGSSRPAWAVMQLHSMVGWRGLGQLGDLLGLSVHVGTGSLSILTHLLAFNGGWILKE